jgi:RHS repeat-associated protein
VTGPSTNACDAPPSDATIYGYDSDDELTSVTPASGTPTVYGYDEAGRLCLTGPTAAGAACNDDAQSGDTIYCYNGDGLRMAKVTVGSCADPTTAEDFTWDLSGALPTVLVDGPTDYVTGPGGLPLEQVSGTTVLWYHHDQLGSTRAITNSSGAVVASYTYGPYGITAVSTGSVTNPFQFAGQYLDSESGLYYLRARYYDPNVGQFLSVDPLVAQTGAPYSYAADDPVNVTDPAGRDYQDCVNYEKSIGPIARFIQGLFLFFSNPCGDANGALIINAKVVAPVAAVIKPITDKIGDACDAANLLVVDDEVAGTCSLIAAGISNDAGLSQTLAAGCASNVTVATTVIQGASLAGSSAAQGTLGSVISVGTDLGTAIAPDGGASCGCGSPANGSSGDSSSTFTLPPGSTIGP